MVKPRSLGNNKVDNNASGKRPGKAGARVGKRPTTTSCSSESDPSTLLRVTRSRSRALSSVPPPPASSSSTSKSNDQVILDLPPPVPEEAHFDSSKPLPTFPLLSLPTELQLHVIKQMGWNDLKSSRQVSKTMEVLSTEVILPRLQIPQLTSKVVPSMSQTRLPLQELSVTQLERVSSLMRPNLFQIGQSITILNMKNPILTKSSLKWLFKSCFNLETIRVDYVNPCYKSDWSSMTPGWRVRRGAVDHDVSFQKFLDDLSSTISTSTCSNLRAFEIYAGQFAQILFREAGDDFHYWNFTLDGLLSCPKIQRINMISYAPILMKRRADLPTHGSSGTLQEFSVIWFMDLKYFLHEIKFIVGQAVFATGVNITGRGQSQAELRTKYFSQLGNLILGPYFATQYDRLVEVIEKKCWSRPEFKESIHSQEIVTIINFFWSNDEEINVMDSERRELVVKMLKSKEIETESRRVNIARLSPSSMEGMEFNMY